MAAESGSTKIIHKGTYLYIYNFETGNEEWRSPNVGGTFLGITELIVADVDSIPGVEMLGLVQGLDVFVFDGLTKTGKALITGSFTALDVFEKDIYTGDGNGYLKRYTSTGTGYNLTAQTSLLSGPIDGLTIRSSDPLVVDFGSNGKAMTFADGAVLRESPDYGAPNGSRYADGATVGKFALISDKLPAPVLYQEPPLTTGTVNTLKWSRVTAGDSYYVEAGTDAGFSTPVASGWVSQLSWEFSGLDAGEIYYYRVKARTMDAAVESAWSRLQHSTQESSTASVSGWELY